MKPDDNINLTLQAKVPGLSMISRAVDMEVDYEEQLGGDGPDAVRAAHRRCTRR